MAAPNLRSFIPFQNFRDDAAAGGALADFVDEVLQPALDLLWQDAVRFGKQLDPDLADANAVGATLLDLGCPFPTALVLPLHQQRALVRALLKAYKQFGTAPGLIDVVRALTGVTITAIISPAVVRGWILGVSVIAKDQSTPYDPGTTNFAVLGNTSSGVFSFQVAVPPGTTADQKALIRDIVRQVKPAHTHFYGFVSSTPPPPQWKLGVSLLGSDTYLG